MKARREGAAGGRGGAGAALPCRWLCPRR
eukprot:SAG31_NODE_15256_length_763_cov_1.331325_1_plen_28_part_01